MSPAGSARAHTLPRHGPLAKPADQLDDVIANEIHEPGDAEAP